MHALPTVWLRVPVSVRLPSCRTHAILTAHSSPAPSVRQSKRGAGHQPPVRRSSVDRYDGSAMLPLLPLSYDHHHLLHQHHHPAASGTCTGSSSTQRSIFHDDTDLQRSSSSERESRTSRFSPPPMRSLDYIDYRRAGYYNPLKRELRDVDPEREILYTVEPYPYSLDTAKPPPLQPPLPPPSSLHHPQPPLHDPRQPHDDCYELPPPVLQESFFETYFEYCYTWCPVLDRPGDPADRTLPRSRLLKQAVALLGSRIEPPMVQHASPATYYARATALFYGGDERDPIASIQALMMLYWWGAAPNTFSLDTVWWWTRTAIHQAQQVGLHRDLLPGQSLLPNETPGLRRRIWWTLFARERLTCLCEGRPCIIDPADCTVREPNIADFCLPEAAAAGPPGVEAALALQAQTWVYWVRLSAIVGRVAKYRLQRTPTTAFPGHLARELVEWVRSVPESLALPIRTNRTTPFSRDVHQLYLPYLSSITLLYLTRATQPLARAYTAATLSASCVARIFEDYLARRSIRFLQGLAGWHVAIALLALLHARAADSRLREAADGHIAILRIALREIGRQWPSAAAFDTGFEVLMGSGRFDGTGQGQGQMSLDIQQQTPPHLRTLPSPPAAHLHQLNLNHHHAKYSNGNHAMTPPNAHATVPSPASNCHPSNSSCGTSLADLADVATGTLVDWPDLFPFVTSETSALAGMVLSLTRPQTQQGHVPGQAPLTFSGVEWPADLTEQVLGLFRFWEG